MSDDLMATWLLLGAFVAALVGMGWFALSLDSHWEQVRGRAQQPVSVIRRLRVLGSLGLAVSLGLCLEVDHASMATLVWVMMLAAAAVTVAFTLTWRPHWLRRLPA